MVKTTKTINLAQLDREMKANGLNMESDGNEHLISCLNSAISDEVLQKAIDAHIAQPEPTPSPEQKLSSLGLTVEDLKSILGV